jgi:uncharacterized protein YbjT (DUF2867 family)
MTREPERAAHLRAPGLEVVVGDVRHPASLTAAVQGADTVISAVHGFVGPGDGTPQSVDQEGVIHLIDAAGVTGADVILVSAAWMSADHPWELTRAKYASEQHLRHSGLPWTILRPTVFTETWGAMMLEPLRNSGRITVFGRGDNPANYVSVIDVAALVARAVDDAGLRGRVIEFGGPDQLTFNQLAGVVQEVAGKRGRVRHVPRAALRVMALAAAPFNAQMARLARASLILDDYPQPFDPAPARTEFPDLPMTDVRTALRLLLADQ